MQIRVTGRHLRLTSAIRAYVEEKFSKAQRYFNHIVWAEVLLSIEKRTHTAEVVLHAGHQTFRALSQAADLYAAVDLASDKIDAQLKKYKERMRERHKSAAPVPLAAEALEESLPRVTVVKEVPVRPMTREQAVSEMERLGYSFWLFQDRDTRQIHVLYRRQDDSYGLLQPVRAR